MYGARGWLHPLDWRMGDGSTLWMQGGVFIVGQLTDDMYILCQTSSELLAVNHFFLHTHPNLY